MTANTNSNVMEQLRAELLQDIAAHTTAILQDHGIAEDIAEQAGAALADHLADDWGGQVIIMPKDHAYRLAQRERQILAEHAQGVSIPLLCRRYHMGQRGIRKLLNRAERRQRDELQGKRRQRDDLQGNLFD